MSGPALRVVLLVAAVILAVSEIAVAGPRYGLEVAVVLLALAGLLDR